MTEDEEVEDKTYLPCKGIFYQKDSEGNPFCLALADVVKELRESREFMTKRFAEMDLANADRDAQFKKAFPSGDVEGHRRYHQTMIEDLEERRRLRTAIEEKTISGLVWSGIVFVAITIFQYLKTGGVGK